MVIVGYLIRILRTAVLQVSGCGFIGWFHGKPHRHAGVGMGHRRCGGQNLFNLLELTDTTPISPVITLRITSKPRASHHAQNPD
jgi:hypothetical protein